MQYFHVYTNDNERYVRDLTYRLLRDEAMTEKAAGDTDYVVMVMTQAEFEKWIAGK